MKTKIQEGRTYLGIELGSTRIKACLISDTYEPIATGGYEWENKLENGYWTYDAAEITTGLTACFADLRRDVQENYGTELKTFGAMGISGMMHGYLAFDKEDNLLVPFRTWRNTTAGEASEALTKLFGFTVPRRWSISHLYQAMLNGEPHVPQIAHITTLSGYVHYLLTGRRELGACDASGMFPLSGSDYNASMLEKFDTLVKERNLPWDIRALLPRVKLCGQGGTVLSQAGAQLLDPTGTLQAGIPVCPPEGDAGTGMVATGSVRPKTGNISAGTSVFSMLVLEKPLQGAYDKINLVTTPDAHPVALVHSNNGCSELDAWVQMFGEFAALLGAEADKSTLYRTLYEHALTGDADCGGLAAYNFLAAEPVAGITKGVPMYFRTTGSKPTLANFFRAQLYAAMAVLKTGMDLLRENENITADCFSAHGGLFKVKGVAQQFLADALNSSISVSETAGEGGAWGMALLAAFMADGQGQTLGDWLDERIFSAMEKTVLSPTSQGAEGFDRFFALYRTGLKANDAI